jgi:hypothetical protein
LGLLFFRNGLARRDSGDDHNMRLANAIRKLSDSAACALVLACLCASAAKAGTQSATGTSGSGKPATSPATAKKKPHATAAHSPGKSAVATSHKVSSKGRRSSRRRVRGQQKIDSERARSIQEALVREHYLNGEATGTWNQASEDAMRRYQADHGWQSKTVPDSRALIQLGLGPSKDHLLNPESAMTTVPDRPSATSLNPTSHSADPGETGKMPAGNTVPVEPPSPQ